MAYLYGEDDEPERHDPVPGCYSCLGTGKVVGFGHTGKECPCLYARSEP